MVRSWIAVRVAMILVVSGLIGISATPASADGVDVFGVNMVQACQEKRHFGASYWSASPYGWYCYDMAFNPPFISPAGGVDVQAWCTRHHDGSRAVSAFHRDNISALISWTR